MIGLRERYTLAVLWLLSVCATRAVAAIHADGYTAGGIALREHMRAELLALNAAREAERAREFANGFAAGLRAAGVSVDGELEVVSSRTTGPAWHVPGSGRPA